MVCGLLTSLEEQILDLPEGVPHTLGTLGTLALEVLEEGVVGAAAARAGSQGSPVPTPSLTHQGDIPEELVGIPKASHQHHRCTGCQRPCH